jgi:hypothetical protein
MPLNTPQTPTKPSYSDLEPLLCDAAGLATSLAMAVEGIGRLALEDEDQLAALQSLSAEAMYAAIAAKKLWYAVEKGDGLSGTI